jgi:hypothetical protein
MAGRWMLGGASRRHGRSRLILSYCSADRFSRSRIPGAPGEGISVSIAEAFTTSKDSTHAIRIALGSVPIDLLRDALDKVKHTVEAHIYL